jgi:hypothetical protein
MVLQQEQSAFRTIFIHKDIRFVAGFQTICRIRKSAESVSISGNTATGETSMPAPNNLSFFRKKDKRRIKT